MSTVPNLCDQLQNFPSKIDYKLHFADASNMFFINITGIFIIFIIILNLYSIVEKPGIVSLSLKFFRSSRLGELWFIYYWNNFCSQAARDTDK
ncbi:hypothetical protein BpHYR1_038439 [Brachionus plicatilis]|uniref:Uncharacterized protein n=1 Tax=Brachionus plicatilis TaxID=10195 RepID=A0A3M7S092_BRAPC|nr:hypothetical protein BpHYR1_038439 [Brachionus plicatilis]